MELARSVLSFCLLATVLTPICGYRILVVCPMPSRSHNNLCRGVVDPLVDRGHEVVLISAFEAKNPKFKDIAIPEIETSFKTVMTPNFEMDSSSKIGMIGMLANMHSIISVPLFADVRVKELMSNKDEKFDLVIFEYFLNEMLMGFGIKFNCPIVALSPITPMPWLATMTSTPLSVATIPNAMTGFSNKMNLWQRVVNAGVTLMQEVMGRFVIQPVERELYNKYFPEESKAVPYDELIKRISATLINSHPSIGLARPLLPNSIEIGGYHIKDPEPLPEDLKKILDAGAKEGVIYFSMGSNLKSSQMSPEIKSTLLKTLGKLKQTVLWKYEEDLPDKPKNVIIRKWMPQTGILAHPNVKLFISHGGLLSCTEAIHFGVPLLAIPIFGDQKHNAKSLEERGYGIMLAYTNITSQSFEWALKESIENPSYGEKAKFVNRLYHDRPMRPKDLLIFYVEHIIRTKGAEHLSPPHLSRCSLLLFDVMGVIFIPLGVVFLAISYGFWKCCCSKKKQQKTVQADKKQQKAVNTNKKQKKQ